MKMLLLSISFALSSWLNGQGNLQFNQVKLVGDAPLTVPTEKVWKIESAALSLKDGIRVPPRFIIGTDTIILGNESYTTTNLENVVSISIDYKGSGCFYPVTGIILHLDGVGSGSSILSQDITYPNITTASVNFMGLGTQNLSQFNGNNVISSFYLSLASNSQYTNVGCSGGAARGGWNYTFRITFSLSNGNSIVYSTSSQNSSNCSTCCLGCFTSTQGTMSTITAISETRSRPYVSTEFPIWVPSGTVVKTLSNIAKLSVLEFNVIP